MFLRFTVCTNYVGYEHRNLHFFNNSKIKADDHLMLVVLKCSLVHDQNGGWTVPYPYFIVCCKNIYLRILFKEAYIA